MGQLIGGFLKQVYSVAVFKCLYYSDFSFWSLTLSDSCSGSFGFSSVCVLCSVRLLNFSANPVIHRSILVIGLSSANCFPPLYNSLYRRVNKLNIELKNSAQIVQLIIITL